MTLAASTWPHALPWVFALLLVLLGLHLAAVWMEERGWIHYRKQARKGYGAALSNAMREFESLIDPAAEHRVIEERRQAEMGSIIESLEPLGGQEE